MFARVCVSVRKGHYRAFFFCMAGFYGGPAAASIIALCSLTSVRCAVSFRSIPIHCVSASNILARAEL